MKCHCNEIEELRVENDLLREKLARVEADRRCKACGTSEAECMKSGSFLSCCAGCASRDWRTHG